MRDIRPMEVSELNRYAARLVRSESLLQHIQLRGQISGFKPNYASGHWYFELKDDLASVRCVMFRSAAQRTSFRPKDGDQVILTGSAGVYEQTGSFQFYADMMRPEGKGLLWLRFEELRDRLRAEGLFDEARKRPLPVRPRRIAVVTSESGAVLHDIVRVCRNRDPGVGIVLVPVPVQGAEAAPMIAEGIRRAGRVPGAELIITGRGGGSMEDLWCFNEECVARAIAESPLPVISAVGHETDTTIADFAADRRASTPSNAAEIAVPDREDALAALRLRRRQLDQAAASALTAAEVRLARLSRRLETTGPDSRLETALARLRELRSGLGRAADAVFPAAEPRLAMASLRLDRAADAALGAGEERLRRAAVRLETLSPEKVLRRGYALVTDGPRLVTSAARAPEAMTIRFADGTVDVRRTEGTHGHEEKAHL